MPYYMDSGPCDLGTDRAAKLHQPPTTNYQPFRGDRSLRRQLSRLVELEYVLVYRSGRGNQRAYQLLYDANEAGAASWQLGLFPFQEPRCRAAAPAGD